MMHLLFPGFPAGRTGIGLLAVRVVTGAAFILHGWPKIQQPFSWMGDAPVPGVLQAAAAVAEFGGGIAWILGALTPLFSLLLLATMSFAVFIVHVPKGDPFVPPRDWTGGSWELGAVYLAVSVLLLMAGPGKYSVDACLFGGGGAGRSER